MLLMLAFAIGGNLPDLDLFMSFRGFARGKLAYLLQHRGYTHTLLGCLALGLLLYGALALWMRWRRLRPTAREQRLLLAATLLGTGLHLLMDFLNSYGVHPFWPLVNRWYYGDSVFIVEPLYWIAVTPLIFVQRSRLARTLLGLAVGAALALSAFSGFVPRPIVALLILFAAGLLLLGARCSVRVAAHASLVACLGITALFVVSGALARAQAARLAGAEAFSLADAALTPLPANPLCWDVILMQERAGGLRLRRATLSIAPGWLAAARCPRALVAGRTTAPLIPVPAPDTPQVRWLGELEIPAHALAALAQRDCGARALLRFVRAPFIAPYGKASVLGDLRFDREPGLGFAEVLVPPASAAAAAVATCAPLPPWVAPRAELLK